MKCRWLEQIKSDRSEDVGENPASFFRYHYICMELYLPISILVNLIAVILQMNQYLEKSKKQTKFCSMLFVYDALRC